MRRRTQSTRLGPLQNRCAGAWSAQCDGSHKREAKDDGPRRQLPQPPRRRPSGKNEGDRAGGRSEAIEPASPQRQAVTSFAALWRDAIIDADRRVNGRFKAGQVCGAGPSRGTSAVSLLSSLQLVVFRGPDCLRRGGQESDGGHAPLDSGSLGSFLLAIPKR